ncbi:unnamed protein product [Rhizophagus irregularis]|nr:unnamed protein product [Rhizophagus irregularis]
MKKIQGIAISEFWEEQPPTDCTHVIVESQYLSLLRDFPSQIILNQAVDKVCSIVALIDNEDEVTKLSEWTQLENGFYFITKRVLTLI